MYPQRKSVGVKKIGVDEKICQNDGLKLILFPSQWITNQSSFGFRAEFYAVIVNSNECKAILT